MSKKHWGQNIRKQAHKLRESGMSHRAIGERLGVPHGTVSRWLGRKQGYEPRGATQVDKLTAHVVLLSELIVDLDERISKLEKEAD